MKKTIIIFFILSITIFSCIYDNLELEVSRGKYSDKIKLEWTVHMSPEPLYYYIDRSDDDITYTRIADDIETTSYNDRNISPGIIYYYRLTGVFRDGSTTDTYYGNGFAMDAAILPTTLTEGDDPIAGATNTNPTTFAWYKIISVNGLTTRIETITDIDPNYDTIISIYPNNDISAPIITDDNSGTNNFSKIDFTPEESVEYLICVEGASAPGTFKIQAWLH
jgi:hypothetical protein